MLHPKASTRRACRFRLLEFGALALLALVAANGTVREAAAQLTTADLGGLEPRAIGPALPSGRIADIAVHPDDPSTWYVAVGSGGVWRTRNAGTTIEPIFDSEGSYSIGTVTIDPNEPQVIWVGTGENVSGRHVGFGDGVYRSLDGGATWRNMGLRDSDHISRILVDPRDSNVVYVASEGPLWSSGGERGVFKSTDRGATWEAVLEISEDTGITSLEMDPENPNVLYAASYQRRRTVWSLLAGGPESGIHKSTDAGATWRRVATGLPKGHMGKIGLAVSPTTPGTVYATIEAKPDEAGFYRSLDAGETWSRRNPYHSGGTGPHYYQEIFASPHSEGRVYQMDVFMNVTEDGGATFRRVDGGADKHSDNHALAFHPGDPDYLLIGTDAGIYESFDLGATWKFVSNLPVTQFYKAAVDNAYPAYNIIGGTQDNGTVEGPVRTFNQHGIRDQDWSYPYGADGYDTAADPEDPNIVYVSWQGGHPLRWDRLTGELVEIQPQPGPDDPPERFNWDAPIHISPHSAARIYYGSQRVWQSDDRGNSWTAISGDLSRGDLRYELPVAGRVQSIDVLWGNTAMSHYATLTSISESPLVEGLIYAGSDDGQVQVTEDGGQTWRPASFPNRTPERLFVNQVRASLHDPDTVFVAADNHKEGDYKPYLLVSRDRGRSWSSLAGNLGDRQLVWAIAQDHVDENLLFLGAEFGLYLSIDGGEHWTRLPGVPTISFRDVEIQRRENDLVGASFGRGFYVLDDYSMLRGLDAETLETADLLFPVRRAFSFFPALELQNSGKGSKGTDYFTAPNPPDGALITYHLAADRLSAAKSRRRGEEQADKENPDRLRDVPLPALETLHAEAVAGAPRVVVVIRNSEGNVVRRIEGPGTAGFHRIAWDLRYPDFEPIRLETPTDLPPWFSPPVGPKVLPGTYSAELVEVSANGEATRLGEVQQLEVVQIFASSLPDQDAEATLTFQLETGRLYIDAVGVSRELARARNRLDHLERAILETPAAELELIGSVRDQISRLAEMQRTLVGDSVLQRLQEPTKPSVVGRIRTVIDGHWSTRAGPTTTHRSNVEIARRQLDDLLPDVRRLLDTDLPGLENQAAQAGAPWTPGRALPEGP